MKIRTQPHKPLDNLTLGYIVNWRLGTRYVSGCPVGFSEKSMT